MMRIYLIARSVLFGAVICLGLLLIAACGPMLPIGVKNISLSADVADCRANITVQSQQAHPALGWTCARPLARPASLSTR